MDEDILLSNEFAISKEDVVVDLKDEFLDVTFSDQVIDLMSHSMKESLIVKLLGKV